MCIRDRTILSDYQDLLKEKRPELITILNQLDSTSVRSIDFRLTSWRSSERLEQLSSCLCKLKSSLKVIQKRNSLSITPKVEDLKVVKKWIDTYDEMCIRDSNMPICMRRMKNSMCQRMCIS